MKLDEIAGRQPSLWWVNIAGPKGCLRLLVEALSAERAVERVATLWPDYKVDELHLLRDVDAVILGVG